MKIIAEKRIIIRNLPAFRTIYRSTDLILKFDDVKFPCKGLESFIVYTNFDEIAF
jgi:hypothetical protein